MRQAILFEPADLTALRGGTPLTIQVGGVELLVLMARSAGRAREAPSPAPMNGTRRTFTNVQRRRLLTGYDEADSKKAFLQRHRLHHGMLWYWRKRMKVGK